MSSTEIQKNKIINERDYELEELKKEKKRLEQILQYEINMLKVRKYQTLKGYKHLIIKLGLILYELDLENEYNNYLQQYIHPLGIDKFMESSEITYIAGWQKFVDKEYKLAEQLFNKSLDINKNNYKALNKLAQIQKHLNKNDLNMQLQLVKEACKIKEDYYLTHINLAYIYKKMKDYKNAEIHFIRTIEIQPNNSLDIYQQYAKLLLKQDKYQQCIDYLIKYEHKFKNDIELKFIFYIFLSLCEFKNKQFDKSLEYAQICIDINPNHYLGYSLKSQCLVYQGKLEEAVLQMLSCINKKNQNYNSEKHLSQKKCYVVKTEEKLYSLLGQIYSRLSQFPQALEQYSKSLEINNKQVGPYLSLIKIYLKQKKYDLLLNMYEQQIIHSKLLNTESFLKIIAQDKIQFNVIRIESFMQNILFGNIQSLELIFKIYDLMKNKLNFTQQIGLNSSSHSSNSSKNEIQRRKELKNKIYYVLSEKYIRNTQSLLLLLAYHKNIKMYIQYLSEYSIWDLLID